MEIRRNFTKGGRYLPKMIATASRHIMSGTRYYHDEIIMRVPADNGEILAVRLSKEEILTLAAHFDEK